ncbi:ketoacyl-ACP synthase III [Micromonospora orduensis]|uniref:Ketoacyl-ACP synthase III n=1 Tax=Micromonospora orduensis TaxID=1420891 RepID=A0A5C4QT96_9ACTN|nr:ketoacyl-ACP synthase III [Micromonospora orduensis]
MGILGTGSYVPARTVHNDEVARLVGVTGEWIERKTHIRSRRFAAPHEATSDLAAHAARRALDQAGTTADGIDYLIVATSTGDSPQPPTAHVVQHLIGARNAACFDINVVCSGFVYALAVARSLLTCRPGTHALVVAADVYSRILDFSDRTTAVLFGDGAGAVVLGPTPAGHGIMEVDLRGSGDARSLIHVEAGGSRLPASQHTVDSGGHFFRMRGREVREFVARVVPPTLAELLGRAGLTAQDIDHFVPHQANGVMLDELVKASDLTGARTHRTLERYGNVGSASIAVTLDEAHRQGEFRAGDILLLAGFGGGMATGACLVRWHTPAGRTAAAHDPQEAEQS